MKTIAFAVAIFICVLAGSLPTRMQAQSRLATAGVYSSGQAQRGAADYKARCAKCHGAQLEGLAGPPLAGADFLNIWKSQPLSDLYGKVHITMPLDSPGTLTPAQSTALVAYILQGNKFPAGGADLPSDEPALKLIALAPAGTPAAPRTAAAAVSFPAVGTLNQVMRGILFPSSNVLFDVQTQDPGASEKAGAKAGAATTSVRYGNVYGPWIGVDVAAIAIAESAPLLMTPGRRCENGKPVPVDRADWQMYVQGLVEAGRVAYKASQSRSQDAVSEATNQIADSCANCHRVYRDVANPAMRCTPPAP
ncbi:MAG: cytochrome c [Acidobacteria bacterium]|nr:cytochrome c [Acidobacteriota bacterium]